MDETQDAGVWTLPNGLTALRAIGVPLFLWLFLSKHNATLSFIVLTLGALTDYFDGKVARALHQESRLGAIADPTIDRLYIAATVVALAIRNFIPWWIVITLLARDIWMAGTVLVYKRRTGKVFEVAFLGKAATFNLLYAFPFLLLQGSDRPLHGFARLCHILGWSFSIWGIGLYLLTALHYSRQALTAKK